MALPSMDSAKVAALVAARTVSVPTYGQPTPASNPEMSSQQVGRAFTIRIELERRSKTPVRELVIWLIDKPAQPYWVLSWTSIMSG